MNKLIRPQEDSNKPRHEQHKSKTPGASNHHKNSARSKQSKGKPPRALKAQLPSCPGAQLSCLPVWLKGCLFLFLKMVLVVWCQGLLCAFIPSPQFPQTTKNGLGDREEYYSGCFFPRHRKSWGRPVSFDGMGWEPKNMRLKLKLFSNEI